MHTFSTRSAEESLGCKHWIFDVAVTFERHKEIVKVLEILLEQLVSLIVFDFVGELINKVVDKVVKSKQTCLEGLQSVDIRLFEELVVEIGVAYFIIQVNLNVVASPLQSHDSFERV